MLSEGYRGYLSVRISIVLLILPFTNWLDRIFKLTKLFTWTYTVVALLHTRLSCNVLAMHNIRTHPNNASIKDVIANKLECIKRET